jgi:hypothetical protein
MAAETVYPAAVRDASGSHDESSIITIQYMMHDDLKTDARDQAIRTCCLQ